VRVTVCELRTSAGALEQDWDGLVAHVAEQGSELVVLPEMGFAPWFAAERPGSHEAWASSVSAHAAWSERLPELEAAVVGTRPVDRPTGRRNEAYLSRPDVPLLSLHDKSYLPDETGFWEASWYDRGDGGHRVVEFDGLRLGVLVCTEMWFLEHGRAYGRAGAHVVVTPRVTPAYSLDKWLAGGRTCAVVSGAWSLSSNSAEPEHGGMGWAIDPEGVVVAQTSRQAPWVTVEIDLVMVDAAKAEYPRYVPEL
jgi:N-carbamoylputrescine amidase